LWRISVSELKSRYAGSIFGLGWAILTPLLMLLLYALVYLVIFRVRVPDLSSVQYVMFIFSGLVPFLVTSEALSTCVGSVVANKAVLSNTVFPIDLVPVKAVLLSQVTMVVGFISILVILLFMRTLSWTILLFPLIWFLQMLGLIGLAWILSLVNLVFRDLQNMIGLILMLVMIISPIAYTADMVPSTLKLLVLLNPFAYFVIAYQDILVLGQLPPWWNILVLVIMSLGIFILGGFFFSRSKRVLIDYV